MPARTEIEPQETAKSVDGSPLCPTDVHLDSLGIPSDVEAFVDALKYSLPRPLDLTLEKPEFWNGLGIWQDRIARNELQDEEWIIQRLSRLGKVFLQGLAHWLGLEYAGTISRLAQAIASEAYKETGSHAPQTWAQVLFLLDALVHNRSHKAIEDFAHLLGMVFVY